MLHQGEDMEVGAMADEDRGSAVDEDVDEQMQVDGVRATIHEISSSGMFGLDGQPDVVDAEKLRYVHEALGGRASLERSRQRYGWDRLRSVVMKVTNLIFLCLGERILQIPSMHTSSQRRFLHCFR